MKLISLNIWGGHVRDALLHFVKTHQDVDIFCLQEVYNEAAYKISTDDKKVSLDIFSELNTLLPNHKGYFRPVVDDIYGIGIFVKKDINVVGEGEFKIYDNPQYEGRGPAHSRILQWLNWHLNDQTYTVINVHGLWNGNGKTDTPERLNQSRKIQKFMDTLDSPKILCGDFNLRPDTESVKILETKMSNLIQKYNVTSTRTSLYPKNEKYADYVFTSPEITLNTFQVMKEVVSDHCPLLLDFIIPQN